MNRYLLDTNIISDFVRNPDGRVAKRIRDVGAGKICTSIIVAAEMRFGVAKGASLRIADRVQTLLATLVVLAFEAPADAVYARMRADLEKAGRTIGNNDLLIAAHAVALGCTLVTDNEREFARIEGLARENWLR